MSSVAPVFIPVRELPECVAEFAICTAATRSCGSGAIHGAQKMH